MWGFFRKKRLSSFQIISIGFLVVILMGALLLMLPCSNVKGEATSFVDALFTATSAVCVTGLIVFDTATHWTLFGQIVIITLIQIGGVGVVTIALTIAMISRQKIGLIQRNTMKEAIAAPQMSGMIKMTRFIIVSVLVIEVIGAIAMSTVFIPEYGLAKGIWYSIFHSISAFCNAGFDLMGIKARFSSLVSYVDNPIINITIMMLIVIGGLGFFTWEDIKNNKWRIKRYKMQSKVILTVTGLLILLPALYFFFCEFGELPLGERILSSFFQAVTPRTAGFNTVDLTSITETGIMLMIVLMLIGGSPGSTAGGMKTTTIAVLFSSAISVFKRREEVHFFGRRISQDTTKNAATIFLMYVTLFLGGGMIISFIEDMPMVTALFETASAIGTVGLTLGVTTGLCVISKIILIILMFMGRVGGLTLIFATLSVKNTNMSKYPQEKITVG